MPIARPASTRTVPFQSNIMKIVNGAEETFFGLIYGADKLLASKIEMRLENPPEYMGLACKYAFTFNEASLTEQQRRESRIALNFLTFLPAPEASSYEGTLYSFLGYLYF